MKPDNAKIVSDISELNALFTNATNLKTLLQNIVEMILSNMKADSCLLYLFDDNAQVLLLKASKGPQEGSVDKVRLKPGEGFAGIAFKELRAVCEGNAVAIPIVRGSNRIGVIILQSVKKDHFSDEDVNIFCSIISPLVTTIEMAQQFVRRILTHLRLPQPDSYIWTGE